MKRIFIALLRRPSLAVLLFAILAALAALLVRDQVIEPEIMGALCRSDTPPWWCDVRSAIIFLNGASVYGYASLALALASLALKGRWAVMAVVAAAGFGGGGLLLYNAYLSATGLLVALLRAARLSRV